MKSVLIFQVITNTNFENFLRVMEQTISGKSGSTSLDTTMQVDLMNMKSTVEGEYTYPKGLKNSKLVHRMLCGTMFGQKWTDLISGQMESQISVLVSESRADKPQ